MGLRDSELSPSARSLSESSTGSIWGFDRPTVQHSICISSSQRRRDDGRFLLQDQDLVKRLTCERRAVHCVALLIHTASLSRKRSHSDTLHGLFSPAYRAIYTRDRHCSALHCCIPRHTYNCGLRQFSDELAHRCLSKPVKKDKAS